MRVQSFTLPGPPPTTIEEKVVTMDASCSFGGDDPDQDQTCDASEENTQIVDQHWGSDPQILRMRSKLRDSGSGVAGLAGKSNRRPPVFLMPGLASTRLVAWRYKVCDHPLLSDIKVLDNGRLVAQRVSTPVLDRKSIAHDISFRLLLSSWNAIQSG